MTRLMTRNSSVPRSSKPGPAPALSTSARTALSDNTSNTGVFLTADNVIDDEAVDSLAGSKGSDWLFGVSDIDSATRDKFRAESGSDDFTELD